MNRERLKRNSVNSSTNTRWSQKVTPLTLFWQHMYWTAYAHSTQQSIVEKFGTDVSLNRKVHKVLDKYKVRRRFPVTNTVDLSTKQKIDQVMKSYQEFAMYIDDVVKDGRLKSLAMTNLETSAMYMRKAINDEVLTFDE